MRYLALTQLEERLPPVPLLLQILFPLFGLANLISILVPQPLFFPIALVFSVVLTSTTLIHLRAEIKAKDIIFLLLMIALLSWAKFIQREHVSLAMGLTNALVGFSLGLLFVRRSWGHMTFRLQYLAIIVVLSYGLLTAKQLLPLPPFKRTVLPRYQALLLFVASAHIYIADFVNRNFRARFWPTIILAIFAFTTKTVSGAIVSVLQLGLITIVNIQYLSRFFIGPLNLWAKKHKVPVIISLTLIVIAVVIITPYLYVGPRLASIYTRSIGRAASVDSFLAEMTPRKAITGFSPSFFAKLGLPNTYLWMIASFGIFSLLVFIAMLGTFRAFFERSLLLLGLFIIMGIYFAGERLFPFNYIDALFIPLLILGMHHDSLYFPSPPREPFPQRMTES